MRHGPMGMFYLETVLFCTTMPIGRLDKEYKILLLFANDTHPLV